MSSYKKNAGGEHLSDAIRSLQNLLDDVSPDIIEDKSENEPESELNNFDETTEFVADETIEVDQLSPQLGSVDIDSHFDMNIPPALPDEEESDDVIPTLSESIVAGDIPVLNEIVKLPDGSTIPEPDPNMTLEMALHQGIVPTPIGDASEAAADAVQIILARYNVDKLSSEVREEIKSAITDILTNAPELEIPDSIV